ncbi:MULTISPECIES: DMT family transporter [Halobacterium]|uniref:DMT family transporter n=1 Tax=Halobacterium TaxID=2239 RepID=UPI00073E2034|nr:DMT family transporter [Halobacterium sp. CBA1132]MCG1002779.1 DMT family transporter [Halobacterium noricense]
MHRSRVAVLFAVVAIAWGGSYVAIDVGLRELPALLFAAYRLETAAVVALPAAYVVCERFAPRTRGEVASAAVNGALVVALTNAFLFVGQQYTTGGVASVLFSTNPVIAAGLTAAVSPSERLDAVEAVGLVVGLTGVAVVVRPSSGALADGTTGKLLLLGGATSLALGSVVVDRISSDLDALAETAWGLAFGAALAHIASVLAGDPQTLPASGPLLAAIAYTGVVSTALAYPLYFELIDAVGPVRANLVSYAVPVVTAVSSWALLGRAIGPVTAAGFAIIAAGFALLNRRALRSLFSARASRA